MATAENDAKGLGRMCYVLPSFLDPTSACTTRPVTTDSDVRLVQTGDHVAQARLDWSHAMPLGRVALWPRMELPLPPHPHPLTATRSAAVRPSVRAGAARRR